MPNMDEAFPKKIVKDETDATVRLLKITMAVFYATFGIILQS